MKSRWPVLVILLPTAAGAGYMAWLSWRAGNDGQWFFGVMAVFFLLLAVTPFLPTRKKVPATELPSPSNTRFVPHWFMLLAIVTVGIIAALALVNALFNR